MYEVHPAIIDAGHATEAIPTTAADIKDISLIVYYVGDPRDFYQPRNSPSFHYLSKDAKESMCDDSTQNNRTEAPWD